MELAMTKKNVSVAKVISRLETQPTVDAAPVRHGQWEEHDDKTWCSECNQSNKAYKPPYCPHCGAKMDKEAKHDREIL
jgi:uncharacterized paraquat-inducible protein A